MKYIFVLAAALTVILLKIPFGSATICDNPQPEWLHCDDFESGDYRSTYDDYDDGGDFQLSTDAYSGTYSIEMRYSAGQVDSAYLGWWFCDRWSGITEPCQDEIYYRWYHKYEADFQGMPEKMARTRRKPPNSWGSTEYGPMFWVINDHVVADIISTSGWLPITVSSHDVTDTFGNWVCYEAYVKAGRNGAVTYWADDQEILNKPNVDFGTTDPLNEIMLDTYWNSPGSPKAQSRFFDEFVISTERIGCDLGSGPVCGDGTCNADETNANCPADCPPSGSICGDANCDPGECRTCPGDCSLQDCDSNDNCDTGLSDGSETCQTDPADCSCSSPDQCCSGSCQTPACSIDSDCGSAACTTYTCSNPGTCTASCSSQSITQCLNSDQCCPQGCTITNDDDCSGCQTAAECSDRSCQTKTCTNNVCVYSPVGCSNNDGCCPSGCSSTNDDDCPTQGGSGTETWGDSQDSDHPGTVQDTYIDVGVPDRNYATDAHINTYTWPANIVANAIIIKWDLSAIPTSSTITDATLQLYMDSMEDSGGDNTYDVSVHKITGVNPDPATCTWDTPWTSPGAQNNIASQEDTNSMSKTLGYKSWSVTDMVQNWVSTPQENRGMLLNSDTSASIDSNRFFASSDNSNQNQRPKLIITYSGSGGSGSIHPADNNPQDGCILENELVAYIALWKQNSSTHPMRVMMRAISLWRAGTGCP